MKNLSILQKVLATENEVRNSIESARVESQAKIKENNKRANDEANRILSDARKEEERIISEALKNANTMNENTKKELEQLRLNFKKENKNKIKEGFEFVLERIWT